MISSNIRIIRLRMISKTNKNDEHILARGRKFGHEFEIIKGILMSECYLKEIPEDRKDETPFNCPHYKHQRSVQDADFNDNVE